MGVEINSAEENAIVVGLAEAARSGKNDGLDYWLGGVELAAVSEVSSEEDSSSEEEGEEEDFKVREDEEEEGEEEEEEEEDSSSQESDHVWQWLSGASMEYTNWWGEGPDEDTMGSLKGGCIQLLRKGATNAKCTNNDGDNGVICEM